MKDFVREHQPLIHGVLSGFDRIRFRGTIRSISYPKGLMGFLWILKVLLKAFKAFVDGTSQKIKRSTEELAKTTPIGRVVYLSGTHDKREVIEKLMRKHEVGDDFTGLIAVLSCVENCSSFEIHKNAAEQKLELLSAHRKCLHYYLYIRDPRFGMIHLRLMTWFPMRVQICLNGREWLARQLDAAGIAYDRLENTFAWVADFAKAQELLQEQTKANWPATLPQLIQSYHPAFAALLTEMRLPDYYWTTEQTEWATDVAFRSAEALQPLYRRLVQHAMQNLSCVDVMRFMQQRLTKSGEWDRRFCGAIVVDLKTRAEGTRIKHRLGQNSLKMYDKFGRVLRIETTIHHAEGLKVYRRKENDPEGDMAWQIPKSHRYRVTPKGRTLAVAISCVTQAKLKNLAQAA